jgi:hypothetical protein
MSIGTSALNSRICPTKIKKHKLRVMSTPRNCPYSQVLPGGRGNIVGLVGVTKELSSSTTFGCSEKLFPRRIDVMYGQNSKKIGWSTQRRTSLDARRTIKVKRSPRITPASILLELTFRIYLQTNFL